MINLPETRRKARNANCRKQEPDFVLELHSADEPKHCTVPYRKPDAVKHLERFVDLDTKKLPPFIHQPFWVLPEFIDWYD